MDTSTVVPASAFSLAAARRFMEAGSHWVAGFQWSGAFVVALSMTLAYALAFYWQLNKPFWAGFSVVILAGLPTVGQSLQKGALRVGGTLLGGCVALCLIAALHQNHMGLLLALSLYMAFTMYQMTGSPNLRYFYFIACIVTAIIVVSAAQTPLQAFELAVSRVEETLLGIGSHMAVSLLFMQPSSRGLLAKTMSDIAGLHSELARSFPRTEADMTAAFALYSRLGSLLERATLLLPAVELENPREYRERNFWKQTLYISRELAEVQRRWLGGLLALTDTDLYSVFPDFDKKRVELEQSAARLASPDSGASAPSAAPPAASFPENDVPVQGAVSVKKPPEDNVLFAENLRFRHERQLHLTAELHALLDHLLYNAPAPRPSASVPPTREVLFTTPNRLRVPVQVMVQFWLLIPLWILLNPPGLPSMTFVELTLLMALLSVFAGNISPLRLLKPFLLGIACVFPLYVFLYPAITSPLVFLLLLFLCAFGVCVLFPNPDQALARNGFLLPWLSIGHFTNTPVYSFAAFANGASIMILGIMFVGTIHYALFDRDSRRDFWNARLMFFQSLVTALYSAGQGRTEAQKSMHRHFLHLLALIRQRGGIEGIPADAAARLLAELGDVNMDLRRCRAVCTLALPVPALPDDLRATAAMCLAAVETLLDQTTAAADKNALADMRKALIAAATLTAAFPGRGRHTLPLPGGEHAA